jgi:hypothetical protein
MPSADLNVTGAERAPTLAEEASAIIKPGKGEPGGIRRRFKSAVAIRGDAAGVARATSAISVRPYRVPPIASFPALIRPHRCWP